ncbi:MAG TPA: sigma-54 dependent transcriptional regulator [Thermoanaerobaculia bacterium]
MPKVLIVEDQPAVASSLRVLFDVHDIESIVVRDPEAAMRAIARGNVGVVLQDMNFTPGATSGDEGVAFFRRVRAAHPDLPILLITAWTSLETAVQLVREGATDYLAKPWDDAKLIATIQPLLRDRERTNTRQTLSAAADLCGIVYESEAMHSAVTLALQVAASDVPLLITGPNGAGKEKIAEIVHANSRRRSKPLVKVNAGALPDELMESELFGAEPGAFTGSTRLRIGRFEAANNGTLFLDEIGNLSAAGQMKLLRVLQSGEFERLGSNETRRVDVRLLCATNADLRKPAFRQDLYFRIAVVELHVPALRERTEDVLPLAKAFLRGKRIDDSARTALLSHPWPGNVRELQNRAQRALVLAGSDVITASDLGFGDAGEVRTEEVPLERAQLEAALLNAGGSVSRAAEALGVSRQALYRRMEKLGVILERKPR